MLNAASGASDTLDVPAQADTYVSARRATTSYDSATSLYISSLRSNTRTAYLQFVVPAGSPVRQASIVLTRDNHHFPATKLTVHRVSSPWPAQMLHATRPAVAEVAGTVDLNRSLKTVSVDVSPAVTGPGVYAFALSAPVTNDAVRFLSRESGSPDVPRLRLTLGDPSGPTPPTPTPTATPTPTPTRTVVPVPTTTKPVPTATKPKPTPTETPTTTTPPSGACPVSAILVPSCGVWLGAIAEAHTSTPRDVALAGFERRLGRAVDISHNYHVDGNMFPNEMEMKWVNDPVNPRMLLINWKPEFGRSWAQVAAGDAYVDQQIDKQAAHIKATIKDKFFLAIHHEPENEVKPSPGSGFTAKDYAGMYRHVALRLKANGVKNIVFVMNYMGAEKWGVMDWHDDLYPGDDVVDWVAYDPYASAYPGYKNGDFAHMMNMGEGAKWPGMYNWIVKNHPGKPIMLAEWGVCEDLSRPHVKPEFFETLAAQTKQFPMLKALVYFDSPNAVFGDTSVDSTQGSQAAFREMAGERVFTAPVVP